MDEAELHWLQPKEIGRRENKSIPVKGETFTGNEENVHWNGKATEDKMSSLVENMGLGSRSPFLNIHFC